MADTDPIETKKQINGRKKDDAKRQRLCRHGTGPDCKCSRFKCFQVKEVAQRISLISLFKVKQIVPLADVESRAKTTTNIKRKRLESDFKRERWFGPQSKGEDDRYFGK